MIIKLDEKEYTLNISNSMDRLELLYAAIHSSGVKLKNGKLFKLERTSLIRTSIKSLFGRYILEVIKDMYKDKGFTIQPIQKHEDILDYALFQLTKYFKLADKEVTLHVTSKASEDSRDTIESVFTVWNKDHDNNETGKFAREATTTQSSTEST
jgi:hypothetical protein